MLPINLNPKCQVPDSKIYSDFIRSDIFQFDYKKLKDFDEWRINKVGRVLSHSAINNHNSGLKRVFKVAVDRGWIHTVQVP